ncbi:hypothetical protein HUT06_31815 [Actinomadura sp. NAK00032]|uniref:hypothetical protein n=1 Tax=Actinomadura sp. NAK00032 TaxID=2742128 RepID=UPI001590C40D|nr:hypothetical protein [Actinomadura sp. NAK00032]QKW38019.1 hypothetical protein HUT06_31815 [Actinomadura sp. NAK00032]
MNDDVGRAAEVVEYLRQRLSAENLSATFEFPLYEHPCGVDVEFSAGGGSLLEISAAVREVKVLDVTDFALTVTELGDYVVMRARGMSCRDALKVLNEKPRRTRWWRRASS